MSAVPKWSKPLSEEEARELCKDGNVDVPEAVRVYGVSRSELYAKMASGELVSFKHGKRRLIPRRALVAMSAAALVATQQQG